MTAKPFDPYRTRHGAARHMGEQLLAQGYEIRVEGRYPHVFRITGHGVNLTTFRLYGPKLVARIEEHRRRGDAARMGTN